MKANLRHLAPEHIGWQGASFQAQVPRGPGPWTQAGWPAHDSPYQRTQHPLHSWGSIHRSGLSFPQNFAKNRTSKQTLDLILTHVFYGLVFGEGSKTAICGHACHSNSCNKPETAQYTGVE